MRKRTKRRCAGERWGWVLDYSLGEEKAILMYLCTFNESWNTAIRSNLEVLNP
jgi:hypothetical protein